MIKSFKSYTIGQLEMKSLFPLESLVSILSIIAKTTSHGVMLHAEISFKNSFFRLAYAVNTLFA